MIVIASGFTTLLSFIIWISIPTCDKCYFSTIPWYLLGFSITVYYVLMFGCVSLLVRESQTGTAYGFITCFQNIGTTFIPPLISYIHDSTININFGYFWTILAFIILSILSLYVKIVLYQWDLRERGGILTRQDA